MDLLLLSQDRKTRTRTLVVLQKKVAGLSSESLDRFVLRVRKAVGMKATVDVLVTSSAAMRVLNHRFRGKYKATDVLSFPAAPAVDGKRQRFAGEIAICADIAWDNAREMGHSPALEVKILVLHGILHLAGFDHERDNGKMARQEAVLRRAFRLPLSLTERSRAGQSTATSRRRASLRRQQRTA